MLFFTIKNIKYIRISILRLLCLLLFIIFFSSSSLAQFYNGSQLTFGKNRVQFFNHFWTFYKYNKFDTYLYQGGKSLAIFTAKYANDKIIAIEKKLDYQLENKIQFVIFNRLSDLKESNIGLISDDQYNVGGITHIVGSKVFIYYDGNHEHLKKQISAGIANVILNNLMFGQQITAKIKNAALLTLPDWYMQGLVSYLSEDWNVELDNEVKDGILSGSFEKFNRLTGEKSIYAGHSIWKFIADKYGEDKIPNILYMTKISKNVESGFLYVLGVSLKNFTREWIEYYNKKYYFFDKQLEFPQQESSAKKPVCRLGRKDKNKVVQQIKISPDGKYAAFVTNDIGQYRVMLYNFETNKTKKIIKNGFRLDEKTDYSFPVMAWHPLSNRLSFIIEKKGKIFLYYYNIEEKTYEKTRLFDFQKILSFSYSQNGKLLAMSAVMNGQTDIYVYNLASHTYEQITKDIYDDFDPVFVDDSKKIIFSSNRINDTLNMTIKDSVTIPDSKQDIFMYDYSLRKKILRHLTSTQMADETNPLLLEGNYISYLSDQNGVINRFTARIDSTISFVDTTTHYRFYSSVFPQTNYPRNILNYDVCQKMGKYAEITYYKGKYNILQGELPTFNNLNKITLNNSPYMDEFLKSKNFNFNNNLQRKNILSADTIALNKTPVKKIDSSLYKPKEVDIDNYTFSIPTEKPKKIKPIVIDTLTIKNIKKDTLKLTDKKQEFVLPRQRNYDVEYSIDQLVNQVDFSFLNNTYQPFTNVGAPIYINPGFNALFKIGVTDLLEDYRITGGVRLSVDLSNKEYILSFENLLKRLDKQILFHRQTMETTSADQSSIIKESSNEVLYILKYPLNQVKALKFTGQLRNDKSSFLSTDLNNLQNKDEIRNWCGLKAEFISDNTRNKGLNLYYGTRYKIFAEVYRQIDAKNKQLNVVGIDFRNYKKISRTFIWANRFAASTSFGTQKLVYYMGGVDNWLFPKFNKNITVATDQNYAYQTLATNMRGFTQNIRNGNSFILLNSELRFPVFTFFVNHPMRSEFLNNFQICTFGDMGTAWTGSNPYSVKNSLFTRIVQHDPITVTIKTNKEPIVGGYGFGLRTKIFGYFVRGDCAWGVDDGVILPNIYYLSLSLDF